MPFLKQEEEKELLAKVRYLKSLQISPRSVCDLEVMATGGFYPPFVCVGKGELI